MTTPTRWGEALNRFAEATGGNESDRAAAEEWLTQAIQATFPGRRWAHELEPEQNTLAFQRFAVVLGRVEHEAPLAFVANQRGIIQDAFMQAWGVSIDGPPWRLAPHETRRPTYDEWRDEATF